MDGIAQDVQRTKSGGVTVWSTVSALALGALLGALVALCCRLLDGTAPLDTAVRTAVSAVALMGLTSARPGGFVLDARRLGTRAVGDRGTGEPQANATIRWGELR